jgi:hypothetical protein
MSSLRAISGTGGACQPPVRQPGSCKAAHKPVFSDSGSVLDRPSRNGRIIFGRLHPLNSALIMPFRKSATSGRIATLGANRADADREEALGRSPEIRQEPPSRTVIGEDLSQAPEALFFCSLGGFIP